MPRLSDLQRVKGDRTMSQGFIAQYAAEAALQTDGVAELEQGLAAGIKESFGIEHEGKGVEVRYAGDNEDFVSITVYPVIYYGTIIPEVAWEIQEHVKGDVERYTGLRVEQVNVHVRDIIENPEAGTRDAKPHESTAPAEERSHVQSASLPWPASFMETEPDEAPPDDGDDGA